jgi:NADPH:quinone reductase-like Zn-dependent oxidoreductase
VKAIVQNDYGTPDVLELKEIDNPVVGNDDILDLLHNNSVDSFSRDIPAISV